MLDIMKLLLIPQWAKHLVFIPYISTLFFENVPYFAEIYLPLFSFESQFYGAVYYCFKVGFIC
jgi:hypothetical protein